MDKTDMQLKEDIMDELRWDPRVNSAQIGITVDKGAVSLMGEVDTYAEKWAAEDATKRVSGVRAVAEELAVKVLGPHVRSDSEITGAVLNALKSNVWVPDTVTARVHQGALVLEGEVEWNYQRDAAAVAVRHLAGIVSVRNATTIVPKASEGQVKERVQAALLRQAAADGRSITVGTSGSTVTLSGNASSWGAIQDAADAAWATPGVTRVIDNVAMTGR